MLFRLSKKIIPVAIALAVPLGIYQTSQAQNSERKAVTINFAAKVGKQPFICSKSYSNLGTSSTTVIPKDFRLYISDLALIDASGKAIPLDLEQDGKWQDQNIALLDFEDKSGGCSNGTVETRTKIVGAIPPGNYQGLQFTLGIPAQLNHADATLASSPLNLTSLWWNWRGGYKFMRLDLENQNTALKKEERKHQQQAQKINHQRHSDRGFPIHIGSTGCQADSDTQQPSGCSNPNRSSIIFKKFNPESNVVVADVANLLTQTDLATNQKDTPIGCMSSPEDRDCLGIMNNLGLSFDNKPSQGQIFFRVE
jgi:uncharacterized repeat protein (TIGR04052 family)